jgi:hypothetical protein
MTEKNHAAPKPLVSCPRMMLQIITGYDRLQPICHSRAGGNPDAALLDSRLRGSDMNFETYL